MKTAYLTILILVFAAGWTGAWATMPDAPSQTPLVERTQETIQLFTEPGDLPSPSDTLKDDQVHVLSDRVEISMGGIIPAVFTDTNSMDPVIDEGTLALELEIKEDTHIQEGDIVSYQTPLAPDTTIVHRIVEVGEDQEGEYFILKGDNNPTTDPGKVRRDQLRRKVIGILY